MTMSNDWWRGTQIQNLLVAHELHLRRDLSLVDHVVIQRISVSFTVSFGHCREIDEIGRTGETLSLNFVDVDF